ncbi:MAG: response regulator [Synergistaceae bacterium]|nr:response regulator [Synergistaceae bacterium]
MSMERETIFIVDDDLTNLTICDDILSGSYNVFTSSSGELLFKMLERHIPDLILLDVEMPVMNGYQVLERLKAKPETSHIPVILLTGKNERELEVLSLGAIDCIIKPFSPLLLLNRVKVHLLAGSQRQKLTYFNNNLLEMVGIRTKTAVSLQNAVLITLAELLENREGVTGGHIERKQKLFRVLLNELFERVVYKEETSILNMAIVLQSLPLYDVGKIVINDSILLKPGRLTENEFEQVKKHTIFGEKVIETIKKNTAEQEFLEYAKIFAGSHHEKWDGSGYPKGLSGNKIPLLGRVMAIADVYDALVSSKPYRNAYSHDEAVRRIIDSKGTHFDPGLVDSFLNVSDRFKEIAMLGNLWFQ